MPEERRTSVDLRYKLKDDCIHDMNGHDAWIKTVETKVEKNITDLRDKIEKNIDDVKKETKDEFKKYVTVDAFKPFRWLIYIVSGSFITSIIGAIVTLLVVRGGK